VAEERVHVVRLGQNIATPAVQHRDLQEHARSSVSCSKNK
jgi:hypothetical protein